MISRRLPPARPSRIAGILVAGAAGCAVAGGSGCAEWLEVDPEPPDAGESDEEDGAEAPAGSALAWASRLPGRAARLDGKGPIVPRTPGLRVPEGYWARVRLDTADLFLPYAWLSAEPAGSRLLFRLHATGGPSAGTEDPHPILRAVLSIAVPEGTTADGVAGLTFGAEALAESTVSLETQDDRLWLVIPDRLVLEEVGAQVVKGVLEGEARRGAKAARARRFRVGFVALRAPSLDHSE